MEALDLNSKQITAQCIAMHYGEVAMGSWKQDFFIFEREIYREYLDTDKMKGEVDKSI